MRAHTEAPVPFALSFSLSLSLTHPFSPKPLLQYTHTLTYCISLFLSIVYCFSHPVCLPQSRTHTTGSPASRTPSWAWTALFLWPLLAIWSAMSLLCWSSASHWASQDERSTFKHNLYASKLCCVSSDPAEWSHWVLHFPPQKRLILLWWHLHSQSLSMEDGTVID